MNIAFLTIGTIRSYCRGMSDFPIIDKLGGRDAVFPHLQSKGLIKTPDAMRMWVARGVIPGDAVREIVALAGKKRVRVTADDLRLPEEAA
jgi:hypothetical protein